MGKVAVCGDFVGKKITGIQRVAYEVLYELDKIVPRGEIELVIPYGEIKPNLKNIDIIEIHNDKGNRHLWIQTWYAIYLIKNKKMGLTLCNESPILKHGIAYIHDIYYKINKEKPEGIRDIIEKKVVLYIYYTIIKRAKHIITVSNTAKKEILQEYKCEEDRITVLSDAWQHMKRIVPDETILSKYEFLQKGSFYFTLGSMSKRKNIKWILEYAKKHSREIFVLSGAKMKNTEDIPSNVHYMGYLEDEQIAALYKNCKAFVFPSLYEGFGMPPLEAVAMGADIIIANDTCLPEIYGDYAYYLNTNDTDTDIDDIIKKNVVKDKDELLNKYSWEKTAEGLFKIIQQKGEFA